MIAFTADNHIGITSQWSIKERGLDFMSSFRNMVDEIIKNTDKEKTLIIGGDLFDTAYPPSFAVEFVQNEIRRLHASAGCSVFGIDGNHDIANGKWLRVCGITPLSTEPTTVSTEGSVTACGISYCRSSEVIEKVNAMADRGVKCDILVLHLAFGELNRMGAASDLSSKEVLSALKAMGVKLVLMGHIHIRQSVEIDGITFAYCGSTEMCSVNEPVEKSFDTIDPFTFIVYKNDIKTRKMANSVIGNEKEFAAYEASVKKDSDELQLVYVSPDVQDGVRRLRELARKNHLMMRVQVLRPSVIPEEGEQTEIDRTTGIIGLENAIEMSFKPDSDEADLIKAILRSPETMKMTVETYMKKEQS